jgi:alanine-glyoxylate transaminase / serine-glyoxylate transaminase / serine-pyruvate transaminase
MTRNVLTPPTRLLLGPGPSNPHPVVSAAMAAPLVGHLDPYFLQVMDETMADLRTVFGTVNHHTIPMSGTGTAGLEAIMFNLLEPGDEAIVGVIGYFGQRLVEIAERAGATVRRLDGQLGDVIPPERVEDELRRGRPRLVALVHAETSTGACQPLDDIGRMAREHDTLFVVDCVTSLGGLPVDADRRLIDAAGSCSQKCLGAPPGLGPVTFGPRAMAAVQARRTKAATWYLDLQLLFQYWGEAGGPRDRAFHHTAPVANIYGFREALRLALEEGLDTRYVRHRAAHERLVQGLAGMGLSLFTPEGHRLPMLNVIGIPDGVDDAAVRRRMLERGIEIGGGFGPLKGKVWRVGLMGTNATAEVVDRLLGELGSVLQTT